MTLRCWYALMPALGLALMSGCYEYRVKYDGWETFRSQIGADRPHDVAKRSTTASGAVPTSVRKGWAILVASFDGSSRYQKASALIRRLTNRYAVTDLWLEEQGGTTRVYRGRYDTLTDLEAQQALLQTRAIDEDGEKPYENVEMVALGGDETQRVSGSADLRAFSGQGFFSLQIGFYDDVYGPDFRDAAEQAAKALREEGHRAFYYHGPNRSMLTLDLFTDADFEQDGPVQVYGPRILSLQERFPNNLANGRTMMQTIGEGDKVEKRAQPSFVVKVR